MNPFKAGDKIRCLDNRGHYANLLTVGKVYTVRHADSVCVYVDGDAGSKEGPFAHRFELVLPEETYIINGCKERFPTQEAAEKYAKEYCAYNDYPVEIAKLVRRCTVKKETVYTLEDVA
ncbi:hypothetical protein [Burkholderia vietnamiensis]|uniref:hypothetical protein n=1 Tax=Burkholderia vietnamiensis TaxID=60552 RepID=UPI0007561132|nr:hypothetical protein [Burkholderia vietnamiensis]KVR95818.1 hypothetical protein WK28_01880 [Burkholderia vietnamiensis]